MTLADTNTPGLTAPPQVPAPIVAARNAANNPALLTSLAALAPPGGEWSVGGGAAPTIYGNGGLPAPTVQRGVETMRSQLAEPKGAPVPTAEDRKFAADTADAFNAVFTPEAMAKPAPAAAPAGLAAPWWSPEYARAAQASDLSGLELERDRRSTAATGDPVKALVLNGVFGGPSPAKPAEAGTPATKPAAAAPAPTETPPAAGMRLPMGGLYDFMPGLAGEQAGKAAIDAQTGLRTTTVGEGVTLGGQKVDPKQKLITNVTGDDAARAGLAPNAGMAPPAGAGNPALGTAQDNLRQINNIRALSADTPTGGVAILPDTNAAENAEKTARWRIDDMVSAASKDTGAGMQAKMAMAQALLGNQTKKELGEAQNQVTMRGQDLHAAATGAGHQVQMRGQDIQSAANADQRGLGMQRLAMVGQEGAADRANRMAIAQLQADMEGKKLTAAEKAATAKQQPTWKPHPMLPLIYEEHSGTFRKVPTLPKQE